ncbi:MAG: endolytic transglycosylase MltG [Methyloceanibacter sp.]
MTLTRDLPSSANDKGALVPAAQPGRPTFTLPRSPAEALEPLRPPEPPDREPPEENSHPFLTMLDGILTFFFIIACAAAAIFYFVKMEFDRPGPLPASAVLVVPKGEGVTAIADRLERDGIIADRRIFMTSILYFMYVKGQGSLKAGEYQFDKHATMREVLDTLVEGKSIAYKVTMPEGLTSLQIVQRLLAHPELDGEVAEAPPEGSLLPDTYSFGSKDTRSDVLQRMQAAQAKFLAKLWEERDPDIMVSTPQEALILASIVEKETGRADERPRVAAVFHNRLKKRMRLQSDPTIIYGLVGGQGMLDHPITQEELNRDTAFNTYKINGLPPTPIANPGRASIEAVLKPAKTNDLYFCADGTGGHVFAPTLAEHYKNVARWREIEREIRAKQAAEAAAAAAAAEPAPGPAEATGAAATGALAPTESFTTQAEATERVASGAVPLPPRNPKR